MALFVPLLGIVLYCAPAILPGESDHPTLPLDNDTILPDESSSNEYPVSNSDELPVAEDTGASDGILTITTYSGDYEAHLITLPDGTTVSIDCAGGDITTLSHFHTDHCDDNHQMWTPDNVYVGQVLYLDATSGATVTVVAARGKVIGGAAVSTTCSNPNTCSMALWVRYGGFDYLTAGDMTGDIEDLLASGLVARGVTIDVVKASHHGTCTNGTSSFSYFQKIKPEYATITGTATSPCNTCAGNSIINLIDAGIRRIYCAVYYDLSCLGTVPPEVRNGTGTLKITTDGTTYSISGGGFADGPYVVDDIPTPTPTATPTWDMRTPTYTPTSTPQPQPWAMFHHDARHTGRSCYAGPAGPALLWSYVVSSSLVSNPVPASVLGRDGRIYAGSYQGVLTFNPDGTLAWSYATGGDAFAPALGGDMKLYVCGGGYLRALDSNGILAWRRRAYPNGGLTIGSDGTMYGGINICSAVDPNNQAIKWSYRIGGYLALGPPPVGSDGRVYAVSHDDIIALDSNGMLSWSYATGRNVTSTSTVGSDERVYVGSYDNRLYALDSNGMPSWSYATGGPVWSSPSLGSNERVYVGSSDNRLYALDSNGMLSWSYATEGDVHSPPALGSDGIVYVGSGDNGFYAVYPDGTLCWDFVTGGPVWSSPSLGSDGSVYFGSNDGRFYCIWQPTPTPTKTPTVPPTPTVTLAPTSTPTPTTTPRASARIVLTNTETRTGSQFDAWLMLRDPVEHSFTAFAVIIMPNGKMLNALTLDTPLRPAAKNISRLPAPFSYLLLSTTVPKCAPKGVYQVVAAFFHAGTSIRSRSDAFLEANASFTIAE